MILSQLKNWFRPQLTNPQRRLLQAMMAGATLKSHRYLDGAKLYRLHPLDGPKVEVAKNVVEPLKLKRLLESNKKFPAETYLLTQRGKRMASQFSDNDTTPLYAKK